MAGKSRSESIVAPFRLIWPSLKFHYAAFREALGIDGIAALFHLLQIHDAAVANLFIATSEGFIGFEDTTVVPSLLRAAYGTVLELGPGPGNQLHRYDVTAVDFIYGVEPSPQYTSNIAAKLQRYHLQDRYKLLTCGIEDSNVLRREGIEERCLDTVLSIQVLCAVRDVRMVMREVWKLLKPGGCFVFWEHERSRDAVTGAVQACWNPAWSSLVGCNLNREILPEILAAGEWENPGDIKVEHDDPNDILPRISGVLRKKV